MLKLTFPVLPIFTVFFGKSSDTDMEIQPGVVLKPVEEYRTELFGNVVVTVILPGRASCTSTISSPLSNVSAIVPISA